MLRRVAARFLATAVESSGGSPPHQLFGLEGRYASALYSAATKEDVLVAVGNELAELKSAIERSEPVRDFLGDPSYRAEDKAKLIGDIVRAKKYSPITQQLISVMADNGRLPLVTRVAECFEELMAAHRNEVPVCVTTASAIDDQTRDTLQGAVGKLLKAGTLPKFHYKVDSRILGGLVVEISNRTYDLSVQSRMNEFVRDLESSSPESGL